MDLSQSELVERVDNLGNDGVDAIVVQALRWTTGLAMTLGCPVGSRDSGVTGQESNGTRMQNALRIRAGSELSHVISMDQ